MSFLKENNVSPSQIRVFAADDRVLPQLSNAGIPVDLYLDEIQVERLSKSKASVIAWLKTHLIGFLPHVNITSIIVGTSSSTSSTTQNQLPLLLHTMNYIHSVLTWFALEGQVKVSVSFSMPFLESLNKTQARDLHGILDFIRKSRSFAVIRTVINGELSMGDHFVRLMIGTARNASIALRYCDVPLVVTVGSSAVPSAVEVSEFSEKILRSIGNNTEAIGNVTGLFAEIPSVEESKRKELKIEEEQIFHSAHRELLDHGGMEQRSISKRTTLHDVIGSPASTLPINPTPTIITVPSTTNPVTVMPANPVTSPVTIPSTTPISIPPANPTNPPIIGPITNPVTTPVTTPTTPTVTNPVTTYPVAPPGNVPITTPTIPITNPVTPPATTGSSIIPGQTWCIARSGVLQNALQIALDYACGIGGADCSTIQPTGSCYNPNTLQNHASYAFNSYFQKNPVPSSCDFGGTATIVNTNPMSQIFYRYWFLCLPINIIITTVTIITDNIITITAGNSKVNFSEFVAVKLGFL
uniref:X8 domain-containing protein n=1 Tax=Nelumbo nucifera TaxID=4432 RepID=A0A822Z4W0_NELNU|nr:TPA_asm: hypothetical protein HUJ06_009070 [Nelumbo nucifera]